MECNTYAGISHLGFPGRDGLKGRPGDRGIFGPPGLKGQAGDLGPPGYRSVQPD